MMVWLASYPRSGNTLLRQILISCFDLPSCEGLELRAPTDWDPNGLATRWGGYFHAPGADEFLERARGSAEPILIKTHGYPLDAEKAIYVIRDGRLALPSFLKYQDVYHTGASTFHSLLIGNHEYGDWTDHYRAWCARTGDTLLLRFEELVEGDDELLARVAAFLGVPGPARSWNNRLAELRQLDPIGFGTGATVWKPTPFWTPDRLRAFYTLHGPLLVELGYATAPDLLASSYPRGSEEEERLRHAHTSTAAVRELQRACDERLAEIVRLKRTCDERAAEIEYLTGEAEKRLALLHEAVEEGDRLRQLIASQQQAAPALSAG